VEREERSEEGNEDDEDTSEAVRPALLVGIGP
jgi:hypothetical protein